MNAAPQGSPLEVLAAFFKLGLRSFGGPIAHLGYFRDEFVVRRGWLDDTAYGELVALCQFLPGPASSQVGFSIGLMRAGYPGARLKIRPHRGAPALLDQPSIGIHRPAGAPYGR